MFKYILSIFFILIGPEAFAANSEYSILVDAGSTGSRIHLFQYTFNQNFPEIIDIFSEKVSPGLSSFASNPEKAGESLKNLFDHAQIQLINRGVNPQNVNVSILATAGMRILPEEQQQAIYYNVNNYLKIHYNFPIKRVETISGSTEGLYGWLDINYLANNFQKHTKTTGSIDVGGASTQIVFETNDTSYPRDTTTLTLNGQTYTVFSKSFLGLGQDVARNEMLKQPEARMCFTHGYPQESFVGIFDFNVCQSFYNTIIEKYHVKEEIPPIGKNQKFIAYSSAFYNYRIYDLLGTPDQATVTKRVQRYCGRHDWNWWHETFPKELPSLLPNYCSNGVYLIHLFYNTYQIKGENLQVTDNIEQKSIDWTLGALLMQLAN